MLAQEDTGGLYYRIAPVKTIATAKFYLDKYPDRQKVLLRRSFSGKQERTGKGILLFVRGEGLTCSSRLAPEDGEEGKERSYGPGKCLSVGSSVLSCPGEATFTGLCLLSI